MQLLVVVQVTALAQGGKVLIPVIGRVVIQVGDGQDNNCPPWVLVDPVTVIHQHAGVLIRLVSLADRIGILVASSQLVFLRFLVPPNGRVVVDTTELATITIALQDLLPDLLPVFRVFAVVAGHG